MAGSITDIVSAVQNSVVAMNSFAKQLTGSFNNIARQLATHASSSQFGTVEVDGTTIAAAAGVISVAVIGQKFTNSLGGDVNLNNVVNYFDGPTVAQGSSGVWFASGTVTLIDTGGAANFLGKLWDGTNVIASTETNSNGANVIRTMSLSGYITNPTGNLRISCADITAVTGKILFNQTGQSKDSTISAIRIG